MASVLFLAYATALSLKSVAGFPAGVATHTFWPWLGDKPLGEDGFYMLEVADNLARTGHLAYTYGMQTTGIQPLATVIFGGLAWLTHEAGGDRWTLIRVVLLFGSVLFVAFAWLMAGFAAGLAPVKRRPLVFGLAFSLVLFDLALWRLFTYGLETGVYLLALLLVMLVWRRIVTGTGGAWGNAVMLGLAGGVAGEARIDFGVLLAFLLVYMVWQRYATVLQALVSGGLALVGVSPWFLYVHRVSGAWLPSSGKAESRLIGGGELSRVWAMVLALMGHLAPWSYAGAATRATTALGLVSVAAIAWVWSRSPETRAACRTGLRSTFAPWALGIGTMVVVYVLLFWSLHFYLRYAAPMLMVTLPLLALALAEQRWVERRVWVVPAVVALIFCGLARNTLHTRAVGNNILAAGYIAKNYPGVPVGAFQSGTNGYFDENVYNLDGKVNMAALAAAQKGRLPEYIDAQKINVLVDWPGYLETLPKGYLAGWEPCPVPTEMPMSVCYRRKAK